jgi:hypothetical protein
MGARNVDEETIRRWISENSSPGGSSYLVYIPTMSQTGTGELNVTEFDNTTGQTFTWVRGGVGVYSAPGLVFTSIHIDGFGNWGNGNPFGVIADGGEVIGYYTIYWGSSDISLEVFDDTFAHADLSTLLGNGKLFAFPTVKIK